MNEHTFASPPLLEYKFISLYFAFSSISFVCIFACLAVIVVFFIVFHIKHFAAKAHWRKWRDSALRHRKGHILEANAARAPLRQYSDQKISTTRESFMQGERQQQRPLRAVMQQPTPKKPWSGHATESWMGKNKWCCMTCLEINTGKSCAKCAALAAAAAGAAGAAAAGGWQAAEERP